MRENEISEPYNVEKMLSALEETGSKFTLFGGEPLLVPLEDLEKFFKFGFEKYKENSIQTNGTLISDRHIGLFRTYNVGVGISVDGPEFCNDARRVGTLESTRKATLRTINAIKKLCEEGIIPSLIVTLHKMNASKERIGYLLQWFKDLNILGVKHIRLHFLENDDCNPLVLNVDELYTAITSIFELKLQIHFDLYDEMLSLLSETDPKTSCTFNNCDPYTTPAVHGVGPNGELHNCGRTNKDGKDYIKAKSWGNERTIALYNTPQNFQGCQGCRFFFACKGHCPGENSDWRNRTEHCQVLKRLFKYFENKLLNEGKLPLSLSTKRFLLEKKALYAGGNYEHGDSYYFEVENRTA